MAYVFPFGNGEHSVILSQVDTIPDLVTVYKSMYRDASNNSLAIKVSYPSSSNNPRVFRATVDSAGSSWQIAHTAQAAALKGVIALKDASVSPVEFRMLNAHELPALIQWRHVRSHPMADLSDRNRHVVRIQHPHMHMATRVHVQNASNTSFFPTPAAGSLAVLARKTSTQEYAYVSSTPPRRIQVPANDFSRFVPLLASHYTRRVPQPLEDGVTLPIPLEGGYTFQPSLYDWTTNRLYYKRDLAPGPQWQHGYCVVLRRHLRTLGQPRYYVYPAPASLPRTISPPPVTSETPGQNVKARKRPKIISPRASHHVFVY